jgi:endothelin-converting enzyme/putative endopeptidase
MLVLGAAATFAAEPAKPLNELPYTPSLDLAAMDRTLDPCVDFYAYSCGGWQKANPIPADQSRWSVYSKVYNDNLGYLWGLLEAATQASGGVDGRSPASVDERLIGDYYGSCIDEAAIERAGLAPLQADLDAIAALRSPGELSALLARLQVKTGGSNLLFGFGSSQDFGDASAVIGYLSAGGLGLPDRDYYTAQDDDSKSKRAKYRDHVAAMLGLLGDAPDAAAAAADRILAFETRLAEASLTRVERRDPYKTYNKKTRAELAALTPHFSWDPYLQGLGVPGLATVNVAQPKFLERVDRLLGEESLETWKTYLRWQLLNAKAAQLPRAFADRDFEFYGHTLRGTEARAPRWKECVQAVDGQLGEALGKVFVDKTFSARTKAETTRMVELIEQAMRTRLDGLAWMSAATKAQARRKLASMKNKIGYPDRWRDYSSIAVERGDYYGNVERATAFENRRQLAKIGKPVDRGEWGMTPPTVNAYYDPQMNDINFPAGILQPPLYDPKSDDAPNYGNTGSTIGHELTHGFDDEGRQFDADGNLKDWWAAADGKEFEKRADCVADQYDDYVIVDDIKINSRLTLGEDVADLGGTILAYEAWRLATQSQRLRPIDGLTPDQRFFVGFAQWACSNDRPEALRVSARTNPHSPGKYRINGVVVNMPEFAQAFSCKPGQPMVKKAADICRIW